MPGFESVKNQFPGIVDLIKKIEFTDEDNDYLEKTQERLDRVDTDHHSIDEDLLRLSEMDHSGHKNTPTYSIYESDQPDSLQQSNSKQSNTQSTEGAESKMISPIGTTQNAQSSTESQVYSRNWKKGLKHGFIGAVAFSIRLCMDTLSQNLKTIKQISVPSTEHYEASRFHSSLVTCGLKTEFQRIFFKYVVGSMFERVYNSKVGTSETLKNNGMLNSLVKNTLQAFLSSILVSSLSIKRVEEALSIGTPSYGVSVDEKELGKVTLDRILPHVVYETSVSALSTPIHYQLTSKYESIHGDIDGFLDCFHKAVSVSFVKMLLNPFEIVSKMKLKDQEGKCSTTEMLKDISKKQNENDGIIRRIARLYRGSSLSFVEGLGSVAQFGVYRLLKNALPKVH